MALELQAFEPFKSHESNSELVSSGKYGVHEVVGDSFVTKQITEAEFSNYSIVTRFVFEESPEIQNLNNTYHGYPFVELVSE